MKKGGEPRNQFGALSYPGAMHFPAGYGFVDIDVTVADFDVKAALWIGAHPRLVVDRCSLAAEIGQRK